VTPFLLRRRSGKIAALVIAAGFGGGTLLLGSITLAAGAMHGGPVLGGLLGYGVAAMPFLLLAAVVAPCKSELWFFPEDRVFRLVTFRPWLRSPRVEQAALDEYAGVRVDPALDKEGGGPVVSLVAVDGEVVPVRQFAEPREAASFAEELGSATGLWVRGDGS
jgi:hypothetical protein